MFRLFPLFQPKCSPTPSAILEMRSGHRLGILPVYVHYSPLLRAAATRPRQKNRVQRWTENLSAHVKTATPPLRCADRPNTRYLPSIRSSTTQMQIIRTNPPRCSRLVQSITRSGTYLTRPPGIRCRFMCCFRLSLRDPLNLHPATRHSCGRSPVWLVSWRLRCSCR